MAPPTSEMRTASVKTCRRMRVRVDPSASRKQASQIGTRGEQDQSRQQHQSRHECPYRTTKVIAIETWPRQRKCHFCVLFGIGLFEIRADGTQIGAGLRGGDSRLQMSHHHEQGSMLSARVQIVGAIKLLLIHNRREKVGMEKHQSAVKLGWRHANDRERMLIQLNHTTDHPTVVVKTGMPKLIAEHDIRSAVCAMLVRRMEKAAKIGLDLQGIE